MANNAVRQPVRYRVRYDVRHQGPDFNGLCGMCRMPRAAHAPAYVRARMRVHVRAYPAQAHMPHIRSDAGFDAAHHSARYAAHPPTLARLFSSNSIPMEKVVVGVTA